MAQLLLEAQAREQIDALLTAAGWTFQDYDRYDPWASRAIALREIPMKGRRCDYLLLLDRQSVGVIDPRVIALEITQDLEAALEQFATIAEDLEH